ncbi:MAG: TonB-dependent receptor [Tannerellaceae bacterium]|nr:TonB-dependent receptor [Tannerellaceae bacterium]
MYDLQWDFNKGLAYEFMGNFDFDINLTKWLTFSSVNSYRYNTWERKEYLDPQSKDGAGTLGSLSDYNSRTYRIYSNQLLKFNKDFDKHSVNALLGYEWNSINTTTNLGVANGFGSGFEVANAAAVPRSVTGGRTERAVQSVFFNANYAYDYKYLLQFSVRRDGASNFGEDAKYGNFYSISGGWNIHREDFFNLEYVNQLKFRVSYGSVGTPPTEPYPQYFMYKVENYNQLSGGMIEQVKNDNLTWEKTFTTGLGLDMMLFNRLTITLDYYNKKTSNLLYKVPVPAVSGVKEIWQNVGVVKNKGFEATVSVDILRDMKDWDWSIDANIGINRNKVSELYGSESEIIMATGSGWVDNANKLLKPGYDMDTWYLTEWAGVNPENGQPQWYTTNDNGERVITDSYGEASKHKTICGRYSPDFFGGFSTNVRYKQIDLGAVFTYSVGGEIYNYTRIEYDSDGAYVDRNQMNLKKGWTRWEKPGDIATHPQAVYQNKSDSNKGGHPDIWKMVHI